MRGAAGAAALAALAACFAFEGATRAAPRVDLDYARGPGAERCPDEAALREAVRARLGYDPFSTEGADPGEPVEARRRIGARVEARGAAGLLARITVEGSAGGAGGSSEIQSPRRDCADLAPALALSITMAIDPLRAALGPPRAPSGPAPVDDLMPVGSGPTPPARPPLDEGAAAPRRRPPAPPAAIPADRPRALVGLGALAALGAGPPVTAGFTVQVGVRFTALSLSLEARGDVPVAYGFGSGGAMGSAVSPLVAAALVPCLHVPLAAGRLELLGCALIGGGAVLAAGQGTGARKDTEGVAFVGARGALEVPFAKRFAVRVHLDLLVPLVRPDFDVGVPGALLPSAPASGAVGAAVVVYLR